MDTNKKTQTIITSSKNPFFYENSSTYLLETLQRDAIFVTLKLGNQEIDGMWKRLQLSQKLSPNADANRGKKIAATQHNFFIQNKNINTDQISIHSDLKYNPDINLPTIKPVRIRNFK